MCGTTYFVRKAMPDKQQAVKPLGTIERNLKRRIGSAPKSGRLHYQLSVCYYCEGKIDDAWREFAKAQLCGDFAIPAEYACDLQRAL